MILKKRRIAKNVIYNIQPPCKCKLKRCDLKIGEERKITHDSFWEQDNFARRQWLSNHVNFMEPERRYMKDSEVSRRRFSRIFILPSVQQKGTLNKISVCQKMFLGTLGYSTDEAIKTIQKSTNDINILIEQHIMKFNPGIFHYRRAQAPNRLYLPSELNCADMLRRE